MYPLQDGENVFKFAVCYRYKIVNGTYETFTYNFSNFISSIIKSLQLS